MKRPWTIWQQTTSRASHRLRFISRTFLFFAFCGIDNLMALKSPKKSRSTSADDSGLTSRSMAARQRWVFRLLALLTPVLLLVAAEIFLRIAGYGYQTSFFLKQRLNGREVLTDNWQFGWRFRSEERRVGKE